MFEEGMRYWPPKLARYLDEFRSTFFWAQSKEGLLDYFDTLGKVIQDCTNFANLKSDEEETSKKNEGRNSVPRGI